MKKPVLVKDIMTEDVATIRPGLIIKDAAHLFLRHRVNGLPVVDDKKNLLGIITLNDIFLTLVELARERKFGYYHHLFAEAHITVKEIMKRKVITIKENTTVDDAMEIMVDKNLHTLPVMKGKKLIGIIGKHDIINAAFYFE